VNKRVFSLIGLLIISILLMAGCSAGNANEIRASLGQEFTLPVGQTAIINGNNLMIKFEAVTADSRCAKGVECFWAGEARCQMQITYNGSISSVVFTEPGGAEASAQDLFNNYKVNFKLEPYPEAGKQIASSDYKLLMTITR
jgi:hypothetical protein